YRHRLRAITGAQLLHNMLDVHLDGLFGDEESFGDVAIAIAVGDMLENLDLTLGQGIIAEVLGEMGGNLRRNPLLAFMNLADYFDQLFRRHTLEQVAARAGLKRPLDFHVAFEGG